MPFTIGGEWIPEPEPTTTNSKPKKPIKISKERRGNSIVTLIINMPLEESQLKLLCSKIKQKLGCGGSVKEEKIEIQGDQIESIKAILKKEGYKV